MTWLSHLLHFLQEHPPPTSTMSWKVSRSILMERPTADRPTNTLLVNHAQAILPQKLPVSLSGSLSATTHGANSLSKQISSIV